MPNKISDNNMISIPDERIVGRIFVMRGRKVMLDRDLAELYGVETKVLNQAVRRNIDRFPDDFMFKLNKEELNDWTSQFVISSNDNDKNLRSQIVTSSWGGHRYGSYAFTEQGVAMLSCVLKSNMAINASIQIIRTFTKLRELANNNQLIWERLKPWKKNMIKS